MFTETYFVNRNIEEHAPMTDREIWCLEIAGFLGSGRLRNMRCGMAYYEGRQDICSRKRTAIGENGRVICLDNLPNNRLIDNQYRKAVIQKTNYFVGKPFLVQADNKDYEDLLSGMFNRRFHRLIKNIATDALNAGIGWLYLFYNEKGELDFKRFAPTEIIPLWRDDEHTCLDGVIRIYDSVVFEGRNRKTVSRAEVYTDNGIYYFIYQNNELIPDEMPYRPYFSKGGDFFNWERIPFVAFKRNNEEMPLIKNVKSLQDALNDVVSDFANSMQEDARNTILVIKNYDGENLAEFRQNLAAFGAVKVRTVDGADGGVSTLQMNVNADNYKAITDILRRAIVENTMCYDAKNDRLSANMNQMNIQSMYSDIDLDTNEMEIEFQAAMEELLEFIVCHFANFYGIDFAGEKADIVFDRDMLMNEGEIIDSVVKSAAVLSRKTLLANHPYVKDVGRELGWLLEEASDE